MVSMREGKAGVSAGKWDRLVMPDVTGLDDFEAAHIYLDDGFIPVPWKPRNGEKILHPAVMTGATLHEWSTTHDDIETWPDDMRCGLLVSKSSGIIAIDVDNRTLFHKWLAENNIDTPSTAWSVTGRDGGVHYLYDARELPDALWPTQGPEKPCGFDVKSNGFIGVEPSLHPSGRPYLWVDFYVKPIGFMASILRDLRAGRAGTSGVSGHGGGVGRVGPEQVEYYRKHGLRKGERGSGVMAAMMSLRGRGYSWKDALGIYWEIAAASDPGDGHVFSERNARDKWDSAGIKIDRDREDARRDLASSQLAANDDFWTSREMLSAIRDWARSRRVSPDALLAEALAGVACHVSPVVQLPPIIGGRATLSSLFALSGNSSAGKGSASRTAADAIKWEQRMNLKFVRFSLGTGEGMTKKFGFKHADKTTGIRELIRTAFCAIIDLHDIDTLAALQQRGGSITITELTKMFSGEELGASYSDPSHVTVPSYTYTGCLIAGVQPARSGVILDCWDSGFPQRWAWFEAVDRLMPDERPDEPKRISWKLPDAIADLGPEEDKPFIIDVCKEVWDIIDHDRVASSRADSDEGQQNLTREKIAAQLMLLDGRTNLQKDDWDLAGVIMRKSARLEQRAREALAESAAKLNRERGRSEGIRRAIADTVADNHNDNRIVQNIFKHTDDWIGEAELIGRKIAKRDRDRAREILAEMADARELETRKVKYHGQVGIQYKKA